MDRQKVTVPDLSSMKALEERITMITAYDATFGSYQVSPQQAVESSIRLMKEGAECVKLEGGVVMAETIHTITRVDVPVVGHNLKFTKKYADQRNAAIRATESFIQETRDGSWPDDAHSFH